MDNDSGVSIMPVPWGRLKAWIDAHQQAERSGFNPHPPSKAQIQALSHVVDFLDEPEPTAETIGKLDYVTELVHFTQAKSISPPKFRDLAPIEVPVDGVFSQRYRTVCILPYAKDKEFPCVGYGLKEGKHPPLLKTKKLSKQYAAKYAYQYIKANFGASTSSNGGAPLAAMTAPPARNSTPSNGNNNSNNGNNNGNNSSSNSSSSNNSSSNNSSSNNSNSNSNNNASAGSYSSARAQAPSGGAPLSMPPSSMLPSPSSSVGDLTTVEDTDYYDSEKLPSLLDQVKTETAYLKLGYPNFEIWPDPEKPGSFAGKPIFKNNAHIPRDMGHIEGALTKTLAKELMAEEVLKFCKTYRKRNEGFMSSFNLVKE